MKKCSKCQQVKSLESFSKRKASNDGLFVWCKSCYRDYSRARYRDGDSQRKFNNLAKLAKANQDRLWNILSNSKCQTCGNNDPEVLEFDHRDDVEKKDNVSKMLWRYSWETILTEINKCDILCANCHRKRTIKQLGTWRSIPA